MHRLLPAVLLLAACGGATTVVDGGSRTSDASTSDSGSDAASHDAAATPDAPHASARVGGHNLLVFGASPAHVFVSHIPAFGAPHDVQVVVEGSLSTGAGVPSTLADRIYSFSPSAAFSLDALRLGDLDTLTGTLYDGNLESGGTAIASGVTLTVTGVVHQHELSDPPGLESTYFVVGDASDAFALHRVGAAPSFDQVTHLGAAGAAIGEPGPWTLVGAADAVGDRLASGGQLRAPSGTTLTASTVDELSCLVGPGFSAPCP